jgi:hypothetical protein
MIEVIDAIDRQVRLSGRPSRVLSLVPSETLSVIDLAGSERMVGRTDYCTAPAVVIEGIASVGGTKGFDVEKVKALRPDLVLANKEENSRPQVQALIDAGLTVHVSFPCTVEESLAYLETLCTLLGVDPDHAEPLLACRRAVAAAGRHCAEAGERLPVCVPIWKDPWMTFDERSYASDVLRKCGAANVFAGRARRYPLAADLGERPPSKGRAEGRDTRYPRIRLGEIVERGAHAVLLPDEPYSFGPAEAEEISRASDGALCVERVDGMDLFWYGTHMSRALERLGEEVARIRARCFGLEAHN